MFKLPIVQLAARLYFQYCVGRIVIAVLLGGGIELYVWLDNNVFVPNFTAQQVADCRSAWDVYLNCPAGQECPSAEQMALRTVCWNMANGNYKVDGKLVVDSTVGE